MAVSGAAEGPYDHGQGARQQFWRLRAKGLGTCSRQLVKQLAGIKSVDVVLPVRRADVQTELRLRVVATPEPATAQLLPILACSCPKALERLQI